MWRRFRGLKRTTTKDDEAGDDDEEMAGEEEPGGELKEGEGSKEEGVGEESMRKRVMMTMTLSTTKTATTTTSIGNDDGGKQYERGLRHLGATGNVALHARARAHMRAHTYADASYWTVPCGVYLIFRRLLSRSCRQHICLIYDSRNGARAAQWHARTVHEHAHAHTQPQVNLLFDTDCVFVIFG